MTIRYVVVMQWPGDGEYESVIGDGPTPEAAWLCARIRATRMRLTISDGVLTSYDTDTHGIDYCAQPPRLVKRKAPGLAKVRGPRDVG